MGSLRILKCPGYLGLLIHLKHLISRGGNSGQIGEVICPKSGTAPTGFRAASLLPRPVSAQVSCSLDRSLVWDLSVPCLSCKGSEIPGGKGRGASSVHTAECWGQPGRCPGPVIGWEPLWLAC